MAKSVQKSDTSGQKRRFGRSLITGVIVGGLLLLILVVIVGMPLAIGHRQDLPLERLYGDLAVKVAVGMQAGSAQSPVAQNSRGLESGRMAYTGSCAVCHGASGDGNGVFGASMYPPATALRASSTQSKSDAELFWIIKNGLSFLGMPGFGAQYNDREIWSLVAYTRSLANASPQADTETPPSPTSEQLAMADPTGEPAQRGAAVYFAQGCALCHGAVGEATGELRLRGGGEEASEAVREGRRGMPAYSLHQISNAELNDLVAYLNTFRRGRG